MSNAARDLLWPSTSDLVLRVVFLHVGQGSTTILIVQDGEDHQVLLHDINHDEELGGIDVSKLMKDLLDGSPLDVFINSHPHNDHLCGLDQLREVVTVDAIWHSGHVPSDDHNEAYALLVDALTEIDDAGGEIEELDSSRSCRTIGDVDCYVVAPAEHVQESIDDETPSEHDDRIHEHCVVLRIGFGDNWILLPGDADRDAWEDHITEYWSKEGRTLESVVLAAPHHGSRSFFKHDESEEPYLEALEAIDPEHVVISAPTAEESRHDHPHDDAVALYVEHVSGEKVWHTGAERRCFIADIFSDGRFELWSDDGQLVDKYGLGGDDEGGNGGKPRSPIVAPSIRRGSPRDVSEAPPFA
jgi:competence protein ComEC